MLRRAISFLYFGAVLVNCMTIIKPGPKYQPTKGEVWPKPQYEEKESLYYTFHPAHLKFKVENETCDILTSAIERYIEVFKNINGLRTRWWRINSHHRHIDDKMYEGKLNQLVLSLTSPCEEYPHFEMVEGYNVTVSSTSLITSSSIWGMLRGLETFSQLFYLSNDQNELRINKTVIIDFPRYQHRGLLLDTSRHFVTTSTILKLLDAMAINKMNVFHWHIVDDQSFPYQSEIFPEISAQGAYGSSLIYTKEDIQMIIKYARYRGIRVIPEFDVPENIDILCTLKRLTECQAGMGLFGHTASWGIAYPSVLTECYSNGKMVGLGPMNPANNKTYKLLEYLYKEIQAWFPDKYLHIGGDEVELECWKSNPELQEYMKSNGMTVNDLYSLFVEKIIPLLANDSRQIVWQEVFDKRVPLSKDTLIQVWKNGWTSEMITVLLSGYRVLFSAAWYLDSRNTWSDLYKQDPRQMVVEETTDYILVDGIVGGEACMWGEMVDDKNIINRVWPRASAVAERLWSASLVPAWFWTVPRDVYNRIEEHACRMNRRGIDAQPPNGPGYCVV